MLGTAPASRGKEGRIRGRGREREGGRGEGGRGEGEREGGKERGREM